MFKHSRKSRTGYKTKLCEGAIAEGLEERKAEKVDAPAEGEDAPVKKERKTRISRKKAEDAEVAEITDEAPAAEVKEVEE